MNSESFISMLVAWQIGYAVDADVVNFAVDQTRKHTDQEVPAALIEMTRLNPKQKRSAEKAGPLLRQFVEENWPDFDVRGAESESLARRFFEHRLQSYLQGKSTPWEVCRIISPIEYLYDFPPWLGKMYDACDGLEPETKREDCPYLEGEVRATLEGLKD